MKEKDDPQTYAIIGAAMSVHTVLGCGFLERVYQEALAIELSLRGIPYERERVLKIAYKGRQLDCGYVADFICHSEIVVELKALDEITDIHRSQVLNYLKATGLHRALILNFGASSLQHERYVNQFTDF